MRTARNIDINGCFYQLFSSLGARAWKTQIPQIQSPFTVSHRTVQRPKFAKRITKKKSMLDLIHKTIKIKDKISLCCKNFTSISSRGFHASSIHSVNNTDSYVTAPSQLGISILLQNFHLKMASASSANDAETIRRNRILSSKLYFDVPSSKVPVIYSSSYDISFLGIEKLHPFDSRKWGRICQFLVTDGFVRKNQIVEPSEATGEDLRVVHPESYLNHLKNSANVAKIIEVPPVALFPNCLVQEKVLHPFRNQVGGSILAAKLARERGWAINVGGGFHHCSAEQGGGFCVYADISLCIHYAFVQLNISRVMIIDLDAHQGNGHEIDFCNDRRVYILDIFNPGIYPFAYEARRYIDQTVEVVTGTTTSQYLKKLDEALEVAASSYEPELVVYNAGTDILDGDPLGLLKISATGITQRDEKVFRFARSRNIPIVMLTSGGYMKSSARVIADSIGNLSKQHLIDMDSYPS